MDDAAAPRIMIIGDDSDFSYLMQRYVRQSGCQMLVADLSDDTLASARREKPQAIVLEADSPEARGWEMLRALKADAITCDIPVVVCTWPDERSRSLAEGAADHLRKPVLYDDFMAALVNVEAFSPDVT